MTAFSSTGRIVHDLGLAANIGGGLFGMYALEPGLKEVADARDRDHASEKAWNRYSWIKLAAHAAFAVPWLFRREMLSGNGVSTRARALTRTNDILVGTSLITGIASFAIGKWLGRKVKKGAGPERARQGTASRSDEAHEATALEKAVTFMGTVNLLASAGVLAVTSLLAIEGSDSKRGAAESRRLPIRARTRAACGT